MEYQTRASSVMYPMNTDFESFTDTKSFLSDSNLRDHNQNSGGNLTKNPNSTVYQTCDSSSHGFYRNDSNKPTPPYFSSRNEFDVQSKYFHRLRPSHSMDALSECSSTSSYEVDFPASGWNKSGYYSSTTSLSSSSCSHNIKKKKPFRSLIKSRMVSPFPSDSSVTWSDEESPKDSVELVVSNLDYNISPREWKEILYSTFRSAVMVMNVVVRTQSDNSNLGFIRVPTIEDGRFAISQFHRKKIGYKRIHVSLKAEECPSNLSNLKNEVMSILKDAKGYVLPLFKFIELFDARFHRSITVSELYKMKDILEIREQGGAGRMVHLTSLCNITAAVNSESETECVSDPSLCPVHCPDDFNENGEPLDQNILPNVHLNLKTFTPQLYAILKRHDGNLPLMSFPVCYAAEFQPLKIDENGGVNLEHLISCVSGINIVIGRNGVKKIQLENSPLYGCPKSNGSNDFGPMNLPAPSNGLTLTQQLGMISKEIVDLLKNAPQCRMAFSKFIPAYHHHFGRQCRVADYGYTKLIELFEAIPHVLQILGVGEKKILTLSHKAQVRRFTSDLLRVLKLQTNKRINLSELSSAYLKVMEKPWNISEYGICDIEDILSEVSSGTIQVSEDPDPVLSIPRREQTPAEIARTKEFSREVVDLLKHNPFCEMTFNKFIPSYHHHFGRQCRVADYGFIKLIELFEAIPHVVEIDDSGEERMLHLTKPEKLRIFSVNIGSLLKASPNQMLPLSELEEAFCRLYNPPVDLGILSIQEIISMLSYRFQIEIHGGQKFVVSRPSTPCQNLAKQIVPILMDNCMTGAVLMSVEDLSNKYKEKYNEDLDCSQFPQIFDYVQVFDNGGSVLVSLSPLQEFAFCVKNLLKSYGKVSLVKFESLFHEFYGIEVKPALYNSLNVSSMLHSISNVIAIKGQMNKQITLIKDDDDSFNDVALISNDQPKSQTEVSEKFQSQRIDKVCNRTELIEDKPIEMKSSKLKLKKPLLVRTTNITDAPSKCRMKKTDVPLSFNERNSHQSCKQIPQNRYNNLESYQESWPLLHPQFTSTSPSPWSIGHIDLNQNQFGINNGMALYPATYLHPAYPGTPHPLPFNSPGGQNFHFAFPSIAMNVNSPYPSGESLQYQSLNASEPGFTPEHFSYETFLHDESSLESNSRVIHSNKMQLLKLSKPPRLAAKFSRLGIDS